MMVYIYYNSKSKKPSKECELLMKMLPDNNKYAYVLCIDGKLDKMDQEDLIAAGEEPCKGRQMDYPFAITDEGTVLRDPKDILAHAKRRLRRRTKQEIEDGVDPW